MSQIDPWVGERLKLHRKRLGLDQGQLGELVSQQLQVLTGQADKRGLSKSAISRLERGSMLPSRLKMEILMDLLHITDKLEIRRIFERCGYPPPEESLETEGRIPQLLRTARQEPLNPLHWLELLSSLNQEQRFESTLDSANQARPHFEKLPKPGLKTLFLAILNSKVQFAYAMREGHLEAAEAQSALEKSISWADEAAQAFRQYQADIPEAWVFDLQIEVWRTQVSCQFVRFTQLTLRHVLTHTEWPVAQAEYHLLQHTLNAIVNSYQTQEQLSEVALLHCLYFRREHLQLQLKWLEARENMALAQWMHESGDTLLPADLAALACQKQQTQEADGQSIYSQIFAAQGTHLPYFTPDPSIQQGWQQLMAEIEDTLQAHQKLTELNLSAFNYLTTPLLETFLLLPAAQARSQAGSKQDQVSLNLLYLVTSHPQSLKTWFYVKAYSQACHYLSSQESQYQIAAAEAWKAWVSMEAANHSQAQQTALETCLQELVLWNTFLPLLQQPEPDHPALKWLWQGLKKWQQGQTRAKKK